MFTRKLRDELQGLCASMRDELDDHLEAINEQSRDTLEVREALGIMDEKIEKLGARIDELFLLLGADTSLSEKEKVLADFLIIPRSLTEVASLFDGSTAAGERALRVLSMKGVSVTALTNGLVTTNPALKGSTTLDEFV